MTRSVFDDATITGQREAVAALDAECTALRMALEFYKNAWRAKTNKHYCGLEWRPKPELLEDCGNIARDALSIVRPRP